MRHSEGWAEEEFTDQELIAALRLVMPADKAAAQVLDMRAFERALEESRRESAGPSPDSVQDADWEPSTFIMKTWSTNLLALLWFVSPETMAKVNRWRARRGLSDDDPEWQNSLNAVRHLGSGGE